MNGSCPVCYESFCDVVPRRLFCGDIICSKCVEAELGAEDNIYYCPECGTAHTGSSLSDISREVSTDGADSSALSEISLTRSTSLSNDEDGINLRETFSTNGYSSNSASETESELPDAITDELRKRRTTSSVSRKPCMEPNCKYKAISHKYCLKHSQKLRRYF